MKKKKTFRSNIFREISRFRKTNRKTKIKISRAFLLAKKVEKKQGKVWFIKNIVQIQVVLIPSSFKSTAEGRSL